MSQEDGTEEDLCSACLSVVYSIDCYEPRVHVFDESTEFYTFSVVTKPKLIDY